MPINKWNIIRYTNYSCVVRISAWLIPSMSETLEILVLFILSSEYNLKNLSFIVVIIGLDLLLKKRKNIQFDYRSIKELLLLINLTNRFSRAER